MNLVPLGKKRRIIVIVQCKDKVLVHKKNRKWSFIDSEHDWPIDKPRTRPINMASFMILNSFLGLLDDYKELKKVFVNNKKYISPNDYFVYHIKIDNLDEVIPFYDRQRKFLADLPRMELHDIKNFKQLEQGKYEGATIEAFGSVPDI